MNRDSKQLIIGMLIISILGLLFFMSQKNAEIDDELLSLNYYSSNYVTAWDVSYGEEDRQKIIITCFKRYFFL